MRIFNLWSALWFILIGFRFAPYVRNGLAVISCGITPIYWALVFTLYGFILCKAYELLVEDPNIKKSICIFAIAYVLMMIGL